MGMGGGAWRTMKTIMRHTNTKVGLNRQASYCGSAQVE